MPNNTKPTYNFTNKTALITGAGGGMGEQICLSLESFGAKVYGVDLKNKPSVYTGKISLTSKKTLLIIKL